LSVECFDFLKDNSFPLCVRIIARPRLSPENFITNRNGFTQSIKLRKRPEPMFIAGFSIQQWLAECTFLHVQPSHLKKEAKEHLHLG